MRKTFLIFSLVAVTLVASSSEVFAQRGRVGVGGGRGGVSIGVGSGYYGSGYYGSPYYSGYYGSPYYNSGRGYYGSRGYYYAPSYYYESAPSYYYSDSVTQVPPSEIRQASYSDPSTASITVLVPAADAQVWFNDAPTSQRGMERLFHTPSLQQGGTYTIKARWTENGRTMDQLRQVQVQPGQSITVNFRNNPGENLPIPRD